MTCFKPLRPALYAGLCLLLLGARPSSASPLEVTNLASDVPGLALTTDPGLVNAWGMASSATSPLWINANGSGLSEIYNGAGIKQALVVTIPGDGSVTGIAFGNVAGSFNGDAFLFVSEDGTVSGWRGALGTTAETLVPASASNVYKGSAFATVSGSSYLYAANFHAGTIDVLKGTAATPALSGNFTDPNLPAGYAPFNIQNLGGTLYVTYARQDAAGHDEVSGAGLGYVDAFSPQGQLLSRVASQGSLNAPWGLAIAPSSFGAWAGSLLVGNFGDGRINAFDATTHAFLGQITDGNGAPLAIDGLWAITPGNGGSAGSQSLLYFSAGPDGETHGLLGVLTPVPEPGTAALLLSGLAGVGVCAQRRRSGRPEPRP